MNALHCSLSGKNKFYKIHGFSLKIELKPLFCLGVTFITFVYKYSSVDVKPISTANKTYATEENFI